MLSPETRREQMLDLVGQWRESGVKARAFAQEHGVTAWTLYYWRQRLDGAGPKRRRRRPTSRATLALVHVVTDPAPRAEGLEIVLASGDRLRASADVSVETLRGVVQALRARC
jgi:transposase-like protein